MISENEVIYTCDILIATDYLTVSLIYTSYFSLLIEHFVDLSIGTLHDPK